MSKPTHNQPHVVSKPELPSGFTCECGEFHKSLAYVYAHWRDLLNFTCQHCQRLYVIVMGMARLQKGEGKD